MLGLMGFSGSLPLYVIHRYYIFVFIDRANKDACLLNDWDRDTRIDKCTEQFKMINPVKCFLLRSRAAAYTQLP